jgi:transposase
MPFAPTRHAAFFTRQVISPAHRAPRARHFMAMRGVSRRRRSGERVRRVIDERAGLYLATPGYRFVG